MHPTSKILLPLDTDTPEQAVAFAELLKDEVGGFKIGLELVNAAGTGIFDQIKDAGGPETKIFYDCKFHDIPNTVAGAVRAAARRGLWMLNVHATGGSVMLRAAVAAAGEGADSAGVAKPLVIAVTVLTSLSAAMLVEELRVADPLPLYVRRLAQRAQEAGCDGVVASPHEIASIRAVCGPEFLIVTPGVRPAGADKGDQQRVMTPKEAIVAGADWLVVGRPITAAPDPVTAARAINEECEVTL